jgi:hypothetical protein
VAVKALRILFDYIQSKIGDYSLAKNAGGFGVSCLQYFKGVMREAIILKKTCFDDRVNNGSAYPYCDGNSGGTGSSDVGRSF